MVNWEQNLRSGIGALQRARSSERNNPRFADPLNANVNRAFGMQYEARGQGLPFGGGGMISQSDRDYANYRNDLDASNITTQFANWMRSTNSAVNPTSVTNDLAAGNVAPYERQFGDFANWKTQDVARRNASGALSKGFGAMLPGLAMMAFPAAGLARVGIGAAMGGITGGPVGGLLGGLSSAVAPKVPLPANALRAPVQAASSAARQFANPAVASRQAMASALGSWRQRNA